jgi:hypothetical protein
MTVEIGTEAAQFLFLEYINGIFVAVPYLPHLSYCMVDWSYVYVLVAHLSCILCRSAYTILFRHTVSITFLYTPITAKTNLPVCPSINTLMGPPFFLSPHSSAPLPFLPTNISFRSPRPAFLFISGHHIFLPVSFRLQACLHFRFARCLNILPTNIYSPA